MRRRRFTPTMDCLEPKLPLDGDTPVAADVVDVTVIDPDEWTAGAGEGGSWAIDATDDTHFPDSPPYTQVFPVQPY